MSTPDDLEQLSRWLAGDLDDAAAAALQARLEREPALKAARDELLRLEGTMQALLRSPPPSGLDDRVLASLGGRRRRWRAAVPWVLLAAALLLALWPRPRPEVVVGAGVELLDGRVRALVGDVVVDIDGVVEVSVEPERPLGRGGTAGGEAMSKRRTLLAAGAGAALTVVVYEGTATVRAADGASEVLGAGQSTRVGQSGPRKVDPPAPSVPPGDGSERGREIEAENALLQRMLDDQETEYRGTPIPWPDEDMPEFLRPEGFERSMREAVARCAPSMEIVGFECSEMPCLAVLRFPGAYHVVSAQMSECIPWRHLAIGSSTSGGTVKCPDGSSEAFEVITWSVPNLLSDVDAQNWSKRTRARVDDVKQSWFCTGR